MKNILVSIFALLVMAGCAEVKYNGRDIFVKEVDYPELDKVMTVYVGDNLVQKGTIVEEKVLVVHETIQGALFTIPAKKYPQIGFDEKYDFYLADGVRRSGLAALPEALALEKSTDAKLCVITIYTEKVCYGGEYSRKTQLSERGNSFQQTLIYSGRIDNKINIGYREFSNNTARPAFNNDVEYDLNTSNTIGYKGAVIEIIKADNSSITYKLIRNFP